MSNQHRDSGFFQSRWNVVLIAFLLIAGFFLFTEHRAHAFGILPYLLLLACPLLHLFGHRRHGGDDDTGGDADGRGHRHEP